MRNAFGMLGMVAAVGLAACSPAPSVAPSPAPSVAPGPPSPSARPTPTPLSGPTMITITASVKAPCAPIPTPCGYGVTLVLPGGTAVHADFDYGPDGSKLTLGEGLPASLPNGAYALVFETAQYSDVESLVPLEDGTLGTAPPYRAAACTSRLDVIGEPPALTVHATFNGYECSVRIRP